MTPCFLAAAVTSSPPTTNVSLLAKANSFPDFIAVKVGSKPAIPITDTTTKSISDTFTTSQRESSPSSICASPS
ncbi:unknown [Dialister sp. CAG:588]|nr:unknown [Dialister sp. CAG:588]